MTKDEFIKVRAAMAKDAAVDRFIKERGVTAVPSGRAHGVSTSCPVRAKAVNVKNHVAVLGQRLQTRPKLHISGT